MFIIIIIIIIQDKLQKDCFIDNPLWDNRNCRTPF